jgi:hypothetical protein
LWITQEIGQLPDRWERFAGYDLSAIAPPENLASLWTYAPNWGIDEGRMEADTYFLSGSILIDMLVERQGEAVIPDLIENLSTASATDEWLRLSTGLSSADLEAEWLDRFHVALDEIVNQ